MKVFNLGILMQEQTPPKTKSEISKFPEGSVAKEGEISSNFVKNDRVCFVLL
jgi:hypothetical protein